MVTITPSATLRRLATAPTKPLTTRIAWLAFLPTMLIGTVAIAENGKLTLEVSAGNFDRMNTPVVVNVLIPASLKDATTFELCDEQGATIPAQLSSGGLLSRMPEAPSDYVSRELTFILPMLKAGQRQVFTMDLKDSAAVAPSESFRWHDASEDVVELRYGVRPVLQYVYKPHDGSTSESRIETSKVYHHLFDPEGKRLLTKGSGGQFPHHKGLFFGYKRITYADGKKTANTWYGVDGEYESHESFQLVEAGPVFGRHRLAIDWHGQQGEVFAHEVREITAYHIPGGSPATLIEFASRLSTAAGEVKLDGDPQHAGVQFRAAQEVAKKTKHLTYFIRPDGVGKPGEIRSWDAKTRDPSCVNLPWKGMSFVVGGQRYTVAYIDHADNPQETRFGERDYGRFGSYFEHDLTPENPLAIRYRIAIRSGEMTREGIARLASDFTSPPAVTSNVID